MSNKKSLYIIYGGPSSEREVSFSSKDYFLDLYKDKNPILVEWLEDFKFLCHPELSEGSKVFDENSFYKKLSKEKCLVIIAGHGEYIEDGYLQQKLALHNILFTGSSPTSCSLAMNKYKSQLLAKAFVKTIPTYKCLPKQFKLDDFKKFVGSFPVFLKPNNLGSSVGCFVVINKNELQKKLKELQNIDYLFQPVIKGVELSVGSVRKNDSFLNLPVTEIKPNLGTFFTWDAKYKTGGSNEITPATVSVMVQQKVKQAANKIHNALGLGYYSRSDFLLSNNNLYYLETNSYPGMSKTSLLPQQLLCSKKVGIFKDGLIKNLIHQP